MYKAKRPLTQPLIIAALIVSSFFLAACGAQLANENWPGMNAVGDVVYLAYGQGVAAVDVIERRALWIFPEEPSAGGAQFYAPPSVGEERLVMGDFGQTGGLLSPSVTVSIYSLDSNTEGETPGVQWVRDDVANDRIVASPTQNSDLVFVGTADNHLLALEADSGDLLWEFETNHSIWAKPVFNGEVLYVASLDNFLYALDAETGSELWNVELGGSIANSPALDDGILYVPSFDRTLHAIDAESGRELWTADAEEWIWGSPAVGNGFVYYADIAGNIYAVSADSGDSLWTESVEGAVQTTPLLVDETLFIAFGEVEAEDEEDLGGGLVAFDASEGERLWNNTTSSPVFTNPVSVDDVVVISIQDESGVQLLVYEMESGDQVWEWSPPAAE